MLCTQAMAKKLKAPVAVKRATKLSKQTLRSALVSGLKEKSGRKDLKFTAAPEVAGRAVGIVPIEKRAGYPLCLPDGAVDPKDWKTKDGVRDSVGLGVTRAALSSHEYGETRSPGPI